MNKCLVLFVEGDTEVEFYKRVLLNARQKRPQKKDLILVLSVKMSKVSEDLKI